MSDRLTKAELERLRREYVDGDEYPPVTDEMRRLLDELTQAREALQYAATLTEQKLKDMHTLSGCPGCADRQAQIDDLWRERTALREQVSYNLPEARDHGQKSVGEQIIEGLEEAVAFMAGEDTGAIVHRVPIGDRAELERELTDLRAVVAKLHECTYVYGAEGLEPCRVCGATPPELQGRAELSPMQAVGGEDG